MYRETLAYGFDYDDYYFLRPHSRSEVLATFTGSWDRSGIMVPFYRPLTIVFHALRFELFGLDPTLHHATSLTLFALAAVLAGWFVFRLTARRVAAVIAMLFFVCHPAMPYSLVAWITNQMHLLQILAVLGALTWWDAIRAKSLAWWLPLLVFGAAAFLIKEDGVMLLPAIIVLHAIRRRVAEPALQAVPRGFLLLAGALVVALLGLRWYSLGALGGYSRPTAASAWRNLLKGLNGVLRLVPADRPWQPIASWFATLLPIAAVVLWRRMSPAARVCLVSGAAVALLFNLPFAFVTKSEQVYVVALGAVLVLTGASLGLIDVAGRGVSRVAAVATIGVGLATFTAVTRDITRDFEPFGPIVLAHDEIVRGWDAVPLQLREYLAQKKEPGAAARVSSNPLDVVTYVAFGLHGLEIDPTGVPYQWMGGPVVEISVSGRARALTIPVRYGLDPVGPPAHASMTDDGRTFDEFVLDTPGWRMSSTGLSAAHLSRRHRGHRIRIISDRAWRPSEVIPGSTDSRLLGLQIGAVLIR